MKKKIIIKKERQFKYVYAIVGAYDTYGIHNLYFVSTPSLGIHGEKMIQYGYSLAKEFEKKKDAAHYIEKMREKYKGIKSFKLEYRKVEII